MRHGALLLVLIGVGVGCSSRRSNEQFIPTEESAQATLEKCLAAWKNGKPLGVIQEANPAIHFADSTVKPERKLTSYSILGPTSGDAQRVFAVKLTLSAPVEEVRARYVVFGLDPLWVMRYEDYEMMSHWDHPMPAAGSRPTTRSTP